MLLPGAPGAECEVCLGPPDCPRRMGGQVPAFCRQGTPASRGDGRSWEGPGSGVRGSHTACTTARLPQRHARFLSPQRLGLLLQGLRAGLFLNFFFRKELPGWL